MNRTWEGFKNENRGKLKARKFFFRLFHLNNSGAKERKHNFMFLKFLWRSEGWDRKCKPQDLGYFEGFTQNCFCYSLRICSTRLWDRERIEPSREFFPWSCYALIPFTFLFHLQYQLDYDFMLSWENPIVFPLRIVCDFSSGISECPVIQ